MIALVTASLDEAGLADLRKFGEVRYQPMFETGQMLGGRRLVRALEDVDVFITEADNLREAQLEGLDALQIIASCRGDPVNIDIPAATRRGIPVLNAPGRNADAVADLTLALMLILGRNIMQTNALLCDPDRGTDMAALGRVYLDLRGSEMWNKTVGIVGMGAIGRKVAERLLPFGSKVIGYDPFVDEKTMRECGAQKVDLDTLLLDSDYVTLHAKVTDETRGMIGHREIGLMKETAFFINTARSALVDEAVLVEALRKKEIAGAGLDVFDKEPLPLDHPFMELENVVLLPHIGGATHEIAIHQSRIIVPDVLALIRGERPKHIVNPEVLPTFEFRNR